MLVKPPALVKRSVLPVCKEPSVKLRDRVPAPVLLRVRVSAATEFVAKVVLWFKVTEESAITKSLKVLVPAKVWVVPRSAKVMVPSGKVALVVLVVVKVKE